MGILLKKAEMAGRMPHKGDEPGSILFDVTFEIATDAGSFSLVVKVQRPEGMDGVAEAAKAKLVSIFAALKDEAETGDLGLVPGRIF